MVHWSDKNYGKRQMGVWAMLMLLKNYTVKIEKQIIKQLSTWGV